MSRHDDIFEIPNRLFVKGIPEGTAEIELHEFFTKEGDVQSLELKVDSETGKSRGFGFVTFDSQRVAEKMANVKIKFKDAELFLTPAKPKLNLRKPNPFFRGMHHPRIAPAGAEAIRIHPNVSWTVPAYHAPLPGEHFLSREGAVKQSGYRYRHFWTRKNIKRDMSRGDIDTDEQERKLFVGGLNKEETDEDQIKAYFRNFGEIVDVTIMRDQSKISRGFGFVLFEACSSVDKIMAAKKDGTVFTLDQHQIEVKRALPKISGGSSSGGSGYRGGGGMFRKIFVGGLASTATETTVASYFEEFGTVTEVELLRDRETSRLRGFAFVTFKDEDSADKCIQKRNHIINKKSCEVKRAQTRSNLNREEERDNRGPPRSRDHRDPGPPAGAIIQPGMMDINTVNQLIAEAHLQGLKQGLSQAAAHPAATLLGGGLGASGPGTTANLLQALLPNAAVSVPSAPPQQVAAPVQNGAAANQLLELLRQSNPEALASLIGSAAKEGARPGEPRPPTSSSVSYSTSYPPPSTYDYYAQQSTGSSYGPVKDEDHKQRSYRPY